MKKLLVPVDFSANSDDAMQFAIGLSSAIGLDITLLTTYLAGSRAGHFLDPNEVLKADSKKQMEDYLLKYKDLIPSGKNLDSFVIKGSPQAAIPHLADETNADLIVMGTKGATNALEVIVGSTTGGVVRYTQTPVLAIPGDYEFKPPKKILVAIDGKSTPREGTYAPLLAIARQFESSIALFHRPKEKEAKLPEKIVQYFAEFKPEVHYTAPDASLYNSLNEHLEAFGTDMLCMLRRKRTFLQRLFQGSQTIRQIYHTTIPLLVMIEE